MSTRVKPILGAIAVIALLSVVTYFIARPFVLDAILARLAPPAITTPSLPDGLESFSARECGVCHVAIYEEWRGTAMAGAFTDPVFQADWKHHDELFLCLNCHAPLDRQQPLAVRGLASLKPLAPRGDPNPDFDAELQAEGVTCVVCHLQDGELVGPIGTAATATHPVRHDPDFASAERCAPCHQFDPPGAQTQRPASDTIAEWRRWQSLTGREESCVDCHMPAVTRALVPDGEPRAGRRHVWLGSQDPELLREGLHLGSSSRERNHIVVSLENRAGHRYPSGDPARALEVRATLLHGDGTERCFATEWIERRVEIPELRELHDTTLAPAETRRVRVAFSSADLDAVRGARVEVFYHRLRHLVQARERAGLSEESQRTLLAREELSW